jgi:hypothetical protein
MNEIVGAIFPIPKEFVNRLLLEKRNVFAKYVAHGTGLKIAPKHKVLFYVSHSSKEIVGEGKIEEMRFLTPKEALEKYGNKLFLNEDELRDYTLQQPRRNPSKKMLVLVLSGLRRYSRPTKFKKPISMTGQYLTREDYIDLLGCAS